MTNKYKVVVGDWSSDGHGVSEFVYFNTNKDQADIKKAYNEAVKKCGLTLDNPHLAKKKYTEILNQYEDSKILPMHVKKLEEIGVTFEAVGCDGDDQDGEMTWCFGHNGDAICRLFLEMAKTQLPDLEYEIIKDETPCINGFWSDDFNVQFGYGCFDR